MRNRRYVRRYRAISPLKTEEKRFNSVEEGVSFGGFDHALAIDAAHARESPRHVRARNGPCPPKKPRERKKRFSIVEPRLVDGRR